MPLCAGSVYGNSGAPRREFRTWVVITTTVGVRVFGQQSTALKFRSTFLSGAGEREREDIH